MKKILKKDNWKWLLTLGAIILLAVMVFSMIANMRKNETTTLNGSAYHIGAINVETGKVIDSKQNIYSDMRKSGDLEITLDEDSQITYKVVFYDEDKKFVSATSSLSDDFVKSNIPENANYFRIVITPNQIDGENVIITIFNMSKYTSMVKVTCSK